MPKYQLVTCKIVVNRKDGVELTSVVRQGVDAVTAPEIEVLSVIYGADNIVPLSHAGWVERTAIEEIDRLRQKYGRTAARAQLIDNLFPGRSPRLPETCHDVTPSGDVPAVDATLDSLKAEWKRRRLKPLKGEITAYRLRMILDGEPDPLEDELVDAG